VNTSPAVTSIVETDGNYAEKVEVVEMSPISQTYHEDPFTLNE